MQSVVGDLPAMVVASPAWWLSEVWQSLQRGHASLFSHIPTSTELGLWSYLPCRALHPHGLSVDCSSPGVTGDHARALHIHMAAALFLPWQQDYLPLDKVLKKYEFIPMTLVLPFLWATPSLLSVSSSFGVTIFAQHAAAPVGKPWGSSRTRSSSISPHRSWDFVLCLCVITAVASSSSLLSLLLWIVGTSPLFPPISLQLHGDSTTAWAGAHLHLYRQRWVEGLCLCCAP